MNYRLSVCIPARNEMWLSRTVQDLLDHKTDETEIIVGLDGQWADPPLPMHRDVTVVYYNKSIGQRAMTNQLVKLSKAKYVAKTDAHCAFDQNFDTKLIADMQDNWTVFPIMKNLHVFDWVCKNGHRRYQGPSGPCKECGEPTERDVLWFPKKSPNSTAFLFDSEPHFQYDGGRKKSKEYQNGAIVGYKLSFNEPSLSPSIVSLLTDFANSHKFTRRSDSLWFGQDVPMDTVGLSPINSSGGVGVLEVEVVGDKSQVGGVATGSIPTDVVNNRDILSSTTGDRSNQPSVSNTVSELFLSEVSAPSITTLIDSTDPVPTTRRTINSNVIKELNNILGGEFIYSEKTSRFHNGSVALIPIYDKDLTESMSLQGSFFLCTREKYWELNLCDENFGSWGSQGLEVAIKTWTSGGKVMCNHKSWYAHLFRTQGLDFGFPYPNPGSRVQKAKGYARELFFNNKWNKAIHPLSWLVERFLPVPGWSDEDLRKLKEHEKPLNNP